MAFILEAFMIAKKSVTESKLNRKIEVSEERCFVGFDAYKKPENLSPDRYDWDAKPPKSEVAIPGVTQFV